MVCAGRPDRGIDGKKPRYFCEFAMFSRENRDFFVHFANLLKNNILDLLIQHPLRCRIKRMNQLIINQFAGYRRRNNVKPPANGRLQGAWRLYVKVGCCYFFLNAHQVASFQLPVPGAA